MLYLSVAIGALALLFALVALTKAGGFARRIEEAQLDAKRRTENLAREQEQALETMRQLLVLVAEKRDVTREMIMEGRMWRDMTAADAKKMLESGSVRVVDVRTPQETAGGILAGALLIPIDDLPARASEIPRDGQRTLVYCAGGGRSAAACEYLSGQGYAELYNLEGGISAWNGPTVRPPRA